MNFLKMTDRVCFTLGLEDIAANDERALAKEYLNEGVVDILSRTRPYTRCINLVVSPDTPVHDLHNSVLALVTSRLPATSPFCPGSAARTQRPHRQQASMVSPTRSRCSGSARSSRRWRPTRHTGSFARSRWWGTTTTPP